MRSPRQPSSHRQKHEKRTVSPSPSRDVSGTGEHTHKEMSTEDTRKKETSTEDTRKKPSTAEDATKKETSETHPPVPTLHQIHDLSPSAQEMDITNFTGQGCYQRMILMCTMLAGFHFSGSSTIMEVLAPPTDHWCKPPPQFGFLAPAVWKNLSIPRGEDGRYHKCDQYDPPGPSSSENRITVPCEEWDYDLKEGDTNIVSEWNLVCDRKWLITFVRVTYVVASMVAVPIAGLAADGIGRRPIVCILVVALLVASVTGYLVTTFELFALSLLMVSATGSPVLTTLLVLLFEVNTPPYRAFYTALVHIAMSLGYIFIPMLQDSDVDFHVIEAIFVALSTLLLANLYVTEESPRWLIANWDVTHASQIIVWIGSINGKKVDLEAFKNILKMSDHMAADDPYRPLHELRKSVVLRKRLLILFCVVCFIAFTVHALIAAERDLKGAWTQHFYLLVRTPALILAYLAVNQYGRRNVLQKALLVTIAGELALAASKMASIDSISAALAGITTTVNAANLLTAYIYFMELFPTVVRNFSVCLLFSLCRTGAILAPLFSALADQTHPSAKFVFMSALGVLSYYLSFKLPETKSVMLVDSIEDEQGQPEAKQEPPTVPHTSTNGEKSHRKGQKPSPGASPLRG